MPTRMILGAVAAMLALSFGHPAIARPEDARPAEPSGHVLVPGTRVRIAPPPGHETGRGFLGWHWPASSASLIVLEIPGPYAEVVAGLDAKGLARRGMKLVEASAVKIAGRDGRLVLVTQESQGMRFRKWIAVLGDAKRTVMLNAVLPEDLAGELPAALKAALLGADWDPAREVDPLAPLPWTLVRPEGLRFAGNIGTMLLYTEDGEVVQEDKPASARLMVAPAMGEVAVGDARAFAEGRVRQLPVGKGLAIESSVAFDAGGRRGWEIVARARDEKAEVDLLVHQVLLVGEGEYHLIVSQCARDQRETWLPRFRACAASWRLKESPAAEAR